MLALFYAPFRFSLDFMRKIDVRYVHFTPGQYGSLAVAAAGILILRRAHQRGLPPRTYLASVPPPSPRLP
jgi:hypothetical protein